MDGTPLLTYITPVSEGKLRRCDLAPQVSLLNRQEFVMNGDKLVYNQPNQPRYERQTD